MTQATKADIGKWCLGVINDYIVVGILFSIVNEGFMGEHFLIKYDRSLIRPCFKCTPLTKEQIVCLGLEE